MYQTILKLYQTLFALTEFLYFKRAQKWAIQTFFTPKRFKRPQREEQFHHKIKKSDFSLKLKLTTLYNIEKFPSFPICKDKGSVKLYELGAGEPVLILHGWSGRASQMFFIAEEIVKAGYKAVLIDAPAHGDSSGIKSSLPEIVEVVKEVARAYPPFKAVIGHSLGGIAGAKAISEGVNAENLITISSPTEFEFILKRFCELMNCSDRIKRGIHSFVKSFIKRDLESYALKNVGHSLKLPGLIFHDRDDKEAHFEQALLFDASWERGQLIPTEGLGHVRILRNKKVVTTIVDFLKI